MLLIPQHFHPCPSDSTLLALLTRCHPMAVVVLLRVLADGFMSYPELVSLCCQLWKTYVLLSDNQGALF